ncbi:MAG: DNA topoisomerase VI subunit B, partial [Candidatus Edwardsbacteria bacterium]|nr:DNA topoisomerase VI subunit B [Candidatus Edwardsbacteria bacterium]
PGILKNQLGKIFAKLLYGSKFHTMKQARGQQGIGISAAGMYGQLTTGKPVKVISRTHKRKPANLVEVAINTQKNAPDLLKEETLETWELDHGTEVTIELTGRYQRGRTSVDEYLRQTAIANPHLTLRYAAPDGVRFDCERSTREMPAEPKEIRPHPYGVELGMLLKMLQSTRAKKIGAFLQQDFSRISPRLAKELCAKAGISPIGWVKSITREECEKLYQAIQETKIMAPPTDCVVPIGEELIIKSLRAQFEADLYFSVTRPPSVYRGNPFVIEVGCAYGGKLAAAEEEGDSGPQPASVLRLANRVPLIHQPAACCITRSIIGTNWRNYGLAQPRGALPCGPMVLLAHMASVWVPFTSEAKEAIADYPEIEKEITLALQEVGRRLAAHVRKVRRNQEIEKKKSYISKYIPHIAIGLQDILGFADREKSLLENKLEDMLEKTHLQV